MTSDRFDGIGRLYTPDGLTRLQRSHVCVVGIGGVGSWAAEAIARTGVGQLTLVDLDEVCVSNINRQLHALNETVGRAKVEVMAERIRAINPDVTVHARQVFFTEANADDLLAPGYDYVIDAIDNTANKCLIIVRCRARGTAIVTIGAAGGRKDSTAIRIADLAKSSHDRLLGAVRNRLRKEHQFPPSGAPFGVDCVFSTETAMDPGDPSGCAPREPGARLNCEGGYGSACHVTGAFGFAAAGHVIGRLSSSRKLGG